MKPAVIALALLSLPATAAFADFDPKGEITCQTQDGRKILINDEFAGQGNALVSGSRRTYFAIPLVAADGRLSVTISKGRRAFTPDYSLRLDVANTELTTRKEGNEMAHFYFVPAELVTSSLWSGDQVVAAKCLQEVALK